MGLRDRLIELRDAIRAAAAASGARDVRVFGSVARGEEGRDSDVDLLVRLEPGRTPLDLARLDSVSRICSGATWISLVSKRSRFCYRPRLGGCRPLCERPRSNVSRF